MRAGLLRHRIAVQDYTVTVDTSYGDVTQAHATTTTVWGSIEPLTGNEMEAARQIHAEATHRVVIRHTTLTPTSRLLFGTRVFEILDIANPAERNERLELTCKELKD